jgi:tetratricopeptide (TPR) repeat protein
MGGEPTLWEDRLAHATVLVEVGEFDDAEVEVAGLLEERPDELGALDLLGKIKHIRGQLSAAVACWAQVHARSPQSGAVHLRLAALLALARDPERGAGEFLAVGRDQLWRKPAAHLELEEAFRLFAARRPDEARAACERVASKYRGADAELYKTAILGKAWIAELTGELDEARGILERLGTERGFESDLDRAIALSRVYEKLGTAEHLEAAVHVATFLDRREERIVNVGRLALLLRALGRDEEARATEARFLDVFRRRMHRPSPSEVVRAAAREYVPLDGICALVSPEDGNDGDRPPRERALALAWSGRRDESRAILSASLDSLDRRYLADLDRIEEDAPSAARRYLESLRGGPDDRRLIVRLLDGYASSPEVREWFSDPAMSERVAVILRRAIRDFPLRPVFWRALGALQEMRGDSAETERCAAKAEALAAAAVRRRSALGRALAASVYHFVGTPKGLIHEIWAQRKPAPPGRGGYLEEILGNVTPEMAQAVRNTFLSVREYALAKFPQQTASLLDFSYAYKVTKEDEQSGGLSAGLPTALAFLSVFLDRPLPQDVASSGMLIADAHDVQIVRAVGETEYKVRGAYNRNLRLLILPEGNRDELQKTPQVPRPIVDELVRFVSDLDQAAALVFGEDLWL